MPAIYEPPTCKDPIETATWGYVHRLIPPYRTDRTLFIDDVNRAERINALLWAIATNPTVPESRRHAALRILGVEPQ